MAVNKEFRCNAHDLEFESEEPKCPHGCFGEGIIVREFRSVPGYKSAKTKFTDQGMRAIARDHGFTDMSNRNGNSVMSNQRRPKPVEEAMPAWKSDQIQHAAPGFSQRKEQAPVVNFSGLGLSKAPGESFTQNKMPPPRAFTHVEYKPYRPRKGMAILSEMQRKKS